jgi:hypothetical protein
MLSLFLWASYPAHVAQAVETTYTPHPPGSITHNVFGKKPGEPRLIDLTGSHTFRMPGGKKFHYIDLVVKIRHLESGELDIQSGTFNFKLRDKLNTSERVVLPVSILDQAGGKLLPDRTMQFRLKGAGIGRTFGYALQFNLLFSGAVDLRPRNGALDLKVSGAVLADPGSRVFYRQDFKSSDLSASSPLLLRNFDVWSEIGPFGGKPGIYLAEGGVYTVAGNSNTRVSDRGYFPFGSPLRGRLGAPISSPRLPLSGSSQDWVSFEMNANYAITKLSGTIRGQDIRYPR